MTLKVVCQNHHKIIIVADRVRSVEACGFLSNCTIALFSRSNNYLTCLKPYIRRWSIMWTSILLWCPTYMIFLVTGCRSCILQLTSKLHGNPHVYTNIGASPKIMKSLWCFLYCLAVEKYPCFEYFWWGRIQTCFWVSLSKNPHDKCEMWLYRY